MLDAVIVGGGIAGLAAAWDLRNRDILVLEASDRLGGRIRSETRDPYWLNLGAHVFSGPGSATARLCADVGVEVASVPGQLAAVELNGRLVVGGRPELYPLSLGLRYFVVSPDTQPKDHLLMAAAVLMTLPVVLLFFLGQRYFVRGVVMSGIKG